MPRRVSICASLLHQVPIVGCLAILAIVGAVPMAVPEGALADDGSPIGQAATVQVAENAPPDGQRSPRGPVVVSQIHNAPGWLPSHTYTHAAGAHTRVVNGPGWNPAQGNYEPGQRLDAYQLTSSDTCTSAASGGPSGEGSAIKDGTCTWAYLSVVDYVTLTGWAFDNRAWKGDTLYHYFDYVVSGSPLRAYALQNESCTSTVAPAGMGTGREQVVATSDGCHWQYEADITYTSKRSYIPTATHESSKSPETLLLRADYEAQLWSDREYVAGENGEALPIRMQDHDDFKREGAIILGCTTSPCYHLIVTTAKGESFRDRLTPADRLAYDPARGVAIRNTQPYKWPYEPAGMDVHDNHVDLIGLQIASVHGAAVNGISSYANWMTIIGCILEGGSNDQWTSHATVTVDTSSVIANSLVISHAPMGVVFKYPGFLVHSTVVNPNHMAGSVGVETFNKWVYNDTTVSNSAIFGFAHAVAHDEVGTSWSTRSSSNATDVPAGDSGKGPWPYSNDNKQMSTVDNLPGTVYGVPMAKVFVNADNDWRLTSASPLRGTGSAFGTFEVGCQELSRTPSCAQLMHENFDTPDINGTARPQAGHFDIGAWQSCASPERDHHPGCGANPRTEAARP